MIKCPFHGHPMIAACPCRVKDTSTGYAIICTIDGCARGREFTILSRDGEPLERKMLSGGDRGRVGEYPLPAGFDW